MKYVRLNKNPSSNNNNSTSQVNVFKRSNVLKAGLIVVGFLLIGRLFYVQIIRHDYYQAQALAEHIKKYEIPAERGIIYAMDGDKKVPIVLNEDRYLVFVDPKFIEDSDQAAAKLAQITGQSQDEVKKKITAEDTRYVVVAKKITKEQKEQLANEKIKGVGFKELSVRTYPQGQFAAQLLGFVNDDNNGQYGIEESMNKDLAGKSGQLKAITDINGVPLAVNNDNIQRTPQNGQNVTLTIDLGMQKITEDALAAAIQRTKASRATAVLIDADSGEIKAMANSPSYSPWEYQKTQDSSLFNNIAVTGAWEPGSVMKPLIMSTSFNEGKLNPGSTYYDSMSVKVDDRTINNSYPWGAQTMSMQDIITKSLNTGAVHILKSLGGGQINEQARTTWHKYLTEHYKFGQATGVQQTGEAAGVVVGPNEGYGLNVRYANMSFGQGLTVTPLQLALAYATLVNGGNAYKPTLVKTVGKTENKPQVIQQNAISAEVSAQVRNILKTGLETNNKAAVRAGYELGAKTGTAEIADGSGNYKKDIYNGVYVGYISGANKTYVLLVRLDEPKSARYASSEAATAWTEISNKILDTYSLKPKN